MKNQRVRFKQKPRLSYYYYYYYTNMFLVCLILLMFFKIFFIARYWNSDRMKLGWECTCAWIFNPRKTLGPYKNLTISLRAWLKEFLFFTNFTSFFKNFMNVCNFLLFFCNLKTAKTGGGHLTLNPGKLGYVMKFWRTWKSPGKVLEKSEFLRSQEKFWNCLILFKKN